MAGFCLLAGLLLAGLSMPGLGSASLQTAGRPEPHPAIDVDALLGDPQERQRLMQAMQDSLYGPWPGHLPVRSAGTQVIDADYLDGRATLEERLVAIGEGQAMRVFPLVIAYPQGPGPHPVVIAQTFGSNCASFDGSPVTSPDGDPCTSRDFPAPVSFLLSAVFGRHIARAPVRTWLDEGFAYASFRGADFVPDDRRDAPAVLAGLGADPAPSGTLMAWAYAFSAAVTVLETDLRTDRSAIAILGHSRHAKAALLAGAWDNRISAVIAHQSGFAGSALSRSRAGERLDRMVASYPHWLAPAAADLASGPGQMEFDQHHLLALIAPRRVLLGNARRDVWSDPNSSYRAARAAGEAWRALGLRAPGADMREFDPGAGLSWFMRPGGHAITDADIEAFLAFLSRSSAPAGALPSARAPS